MQIDDFVSSLPGKIGTVVHAGAGLCKELEVYEQLGARQIVLLEPHPDLCQQLVSKTRSHANVSTLNVALGTTAGEVEFWVNRVARLSGLYKPLNLLDVYPNAADTERRQVESITFAELAANVEQADEPSLLVLDINGAEHELLSAARARDLKPFAWIVLRASQPDSFQLPAPPSQSVREHIQRLGFTGFRFRQPGAPFEFHLAQRSDAPDLRAELDRVTEALHGARYARDESAQEIARLTTQLNEAVQLEKTKSEASAHELARVQQELQQTRKSAAEEMNREKVAFEQARQTGIDEMNQLKLALEQAQQAAGAEKSRLQQTVEELESAKSAQSEEIERLRASLSAAKEQLATAQAQHADTVAHLQQSLSEATTRLEAEHAEMLERQNLLDREVLRAEAQLELVKDVLLREKAF